MIFAAISFSGRLPSFLYKLQIRKSGSGASPASGTLIGAFIVGVSSAAVASPCTTPVLGGVLTAISQVKERSWGIAPMLFFAVGLSFIFLSTGLGLAKISKLPKAGTWMTFIHKASSVLLAVGGVYFILKGVHVI